ncbi:L-aspartate oxidase [Mesobacillus boroniphilus]|uniref:L-aspartate oxidase n=1 Tax=Mesobacillus boroniphilus TaxID=308892 RepID=A0A944CMB6_9BACI|nr:L-aspartate oxidase [Mesobacillus boroniphilus]MBS8265055.1 L-aspartate oxidase [Mesobacillus boroniphilus]
MKQSNVIIVGSGIAALQLANKLPKDLNVIILTKKEMTAGNSYLAQGGVAAAVAPSDDPYFHYLDTMEAGGHHNNSEAVLEITKKAPELIKGLWQSGCRFDEDGEGKLLLGMEGAHSEKRIVHSGGDATGKHMVDFLLSNLDANISIEQSTFVYELILDSEGTRCIGVKAKCMDGTNETYLAPHVVLATGGCGQVFAFTSNADTTTGDGMALAYRAGAELADMEFVQFHPTLLYVDGKTRGLISEAVRGEGGVLVTAEGKRIMDGIHPLKDLAPRHIVSQTIYDYSRRGIQIFLDITTIDDFSSRFPTISKLCSEHGIDIDKGLIPVVPGSHFIMGGVKTDLHGRTSISGLYAIGEAACTGIHGANRLASNSLLEGMFVGGNLADWINSHQVANIEEASIMDIPNQVAKREARMCILNQTVFDGELPDMALLKETMMDRTGIVRTKELLTLQNEWLAQFSLEEWLEARLDHLQPSELNRLFMYITASLITQSALDRTESRGGHYRKDFPHEDNANWMKKQIIHQRKNVKDGKHEFNQTALAT